MTYIAGRKERAGKRFDPKAKKEGAMSVHKAIVVL